MLVKLESVCFAKIQNNTLVPCHQILNSFKVSKSPLVFSAYSSNNQRPPSNKQHKNSSLHFRRNEVRAFAVSESDITSDTEVSPPVLQYRVGHGFDLHRLEEGYPLIIGGLNIPHTKGCFAHSDGDVLLHCIVDAILGALGLPDIGQIFPDTDPKWKGASSDIFIKEAVRLMKERGYVIGNLDATIIAQKPKLSPHKKMIKKNLCGFLEAHPSTVNIKAKTHEKVDSIEEGGALLVML